MSDDPTRIWDFSAALNAINSVQLKQSNIQQSDSVSSSPPSLTHSISSDSGGDARPIVPTSLGDLAKVFEYIGKDVYDGNTATKFESSDDFSAALTKDPLGGRDDDTTWLSQLRSGKIGIREGKSVELKRAKEAKISRTVTFDDDSLAVVPSRQAVTSDEEATGLSHLTKSARKNERRRLRELAAERSTEDDTITGPKLFSAAAFFHSTSDADTDAEKKLAAQQSQSRRNIIQELLTPTKKPAKAKKPMSPHDLFLHQVSEQYVSEPLPGELDSTPSRLRNGTTFGNMSSVPPPVDLNDTFQKKTSLMKALVRNFPEDASFITNMRPMYSNAYDQADLDPAGIHIFVDMSNILIGLHNAIKVNRGLGIHARIPRQKLSFYNFSLILERGRSVAKRCLAGSDILESVEEAMTLGYENNCLDRVYKMKKMTPRRRYWLERDRTQRTNGDKSGASSGGEGYRSGLGSGAEEPEAKYVEQGVDEILHLKMMESVVDSEPGTIVLATGDAAEAEYSEGFLRMCERALSKGWKVELVSFRANMSGEYRRKDWVKRWNGNFRIVELDEYAEMLRL